MSRPEHLSVPNTAEGIRAINEAQRHYDEDPSFYEAREQAAMEEMMQQEEYQRAEYEAQMQAEAEAQQQAEAEQ